MMNTIGSIEDRRRTAKNEAWAADLTTLRRHLPAMQTTQAELSHSVGQLQLKQGTATRVYAWYLLNGLGDLHASAVLALEQERDFSAMSLAQDAIHLATNVTYVLEDPAGDRLSSALRDLLDSQHARFVAWQAAMPEDRKPGQEAQRVKEECHKSPWHATASAWPTLATRADAAGLGPWVHPTLAAAANTEQVAAQELMNYLKCERGSLSERQAAHSYRIARCASDALCIEAIGLRLFAVALQRMASLLKDAVASTIADSAIERMDNMIADHARLADAHDNDNNVYFAVRSG